MPLLIFGCTYVRLSPSEPQWLTKPFAQKSSHYELGNGLYVAASYPFSHEYEFKTAAVMHDGIVIVGDNFGALWLRTERRSLIL